MIRPTVLINHVAEDLNTGGFKLVDIRNITPKINFVYPGFYPPGACCHKGKCMVGITFSPPAGEGDDADVRAMVYVNNDMVEELDPQILNPTTGHTGTFYVPEDLDVSCIQIRFRNAAGQKSRFSEPYYFAPKPIRMLV